MHVISMLRRYITYLQLQRHSARLHFHKLFFCIPLFCAVQDAAELSGLSLSRLQECRELGVALACDCLEQSCR